MSGWSLRSVSVALALTCLGCGAGGIAGESSSGVEAPSGECDDTNPCESGLRCTSPEQHAWNRCEERSRARCATGEVGDDCGNCFTSCLSNAECSDGKVCNGAYCESPRRCLALR